MPETEKFSAVVLAAGAGKRMHAAVPKQYMDLCGKPLIYYALQAFEDSSVDEIILVVTSGDEEYCRTQIVEKYGFRKVRHIVPGGRERSESVLNGVRAAAGTYVLIHDGARAFLTGDVIRRMMEAAVKYKAAIAAVPEKNTIKIGDTEGFVTSTPDRSALWEVQTPQAFDRQLLLDAYAWLLQKKSCSAEDSDAYNTPLHKRECGLDNPHMRDESVRKKSGCTENSQEHGKKNAPADLANSPKQRQEENKTNRTVLDFSTLTDDAMVVEQGGILPDGTHPRIRLVMGDYLNIKVTTPEDLILGEAILRHHAQAAESHR